MFPLKYEDEQERYNRGLERMRGWLTDDVAKRKFDSGNYHVGVVCNNSFACYQRRDVVIFEDQSGHSERIQKVSIERPMTLEEIACQKDVGSLIRTVGTTINVPRPFIYDITDEFS